MKAKLLAATLAGAVIALAGTSCSKQEVQMQPGKQTTCPVMKGKKIDSKQYVDVNGKRIYVCCPGCIAPIKANPEKYIGEMEAAGVVLEDAPAKAESKEAE